MSATTLAQFLIFDIALVITIFLQIVINQTLPLILCRQLSQDHISVNFLKIFQIKRYIIMTNCITPFLNVFFDLFLAYISFCAFLHELHYFLSINLTTLIIVHQFKCSSSSEMNHRFPRNHCFQLISVHTTQ